MKNGPETQRCPLVRSVDSGRLVLREKWRITCRCTGRNVMQGSETVARSIVDATAVEQAVGRLDGVALRTPLQRNSRLSARTGADVWLKREDLQIGRSYKLRGAYNLIAQLSDAEKKAGVVCASAGNHGQGLAYSCHTLGVHGRVYVPRTTPRQKRDRIAALGGSQVEVIITGDSYDDAAAAALGLVGGHGSDPGAGVRRPANRCWARDRGCRARRAARSGARRTGGSCWWRWVDRRRCDVLGGAASRRTDCRRRAGWCGEHGCCVGCG